MGIIQNTLIIFGGVDPASSLIFSDTWAFNLYSNTWTRLSAAANSVESMGFMPPPLYRAHLVPQETECIKANGVPSTCGVLIYGGLGGNDFHTLLGQVYRASLTFSTYSPDRIDSPYSSNPTLVSPGSEAYSATTGANKQRYFISNHTWDFARLTDEGSVLFLRSCMNTFFPKKSNMLTLSLLHGVCVLCIYFSTPRI